MIFSIPLLAMTNAKSVRVFNIKSLVEKNCKLITK
jgi:hypothetical protein